MINNIGIVGCGQCGGNIGVQFEKAGYRGIFINSSKKDLQTIDAKFKFHIPNAEGCSKEREKALELVKKYYHDIAHEILDKLAEQSYILLITSTGGGTGSGLTPILADVLRSKAPHKSIGLVAVLPSTNETVQTQINTIKFFKEISQIEFLKSIFILDNDKLQKFAINKEFFDLFQAMVNIPNNISTKGNLDESEIWKMLNTNGITIIATAETNRNNHTSNIIKSFEQNIFAPIEKDKQIKYLGISLAEDINMYDIESYIGKPLDTFQGYNNDKTITILSGLSMPQQRLQQINEIAYSNRNIIQNARTTNISLDIDTSWLSDLSNSPKPKTETIDLDDIFSKYQ